MSYFIFREVECLDAPSYMAAMPHAIQIQKMWNEKGPEFTSAIMSPTASGNPIRIRWMMRADSIDRAVAANAELLKDTAYLQAVKSLAELVDNSTWYDEAWLELNA